MSSSSSARKGSQKPRIRLDPKRSYTDGAEAAELASAYGLTPDEWQRDLLDSWLGRDEHDKYTASRCGLSVPRQNGKNGVLEMRELYGMCIVGECILHTAHEVKTARKAFLRLAGFFENEKKYPELAEMVLQIRRTNGQEAIELKNGGKIEFSARSRGAARGFTVDVVVFDEAQELTDEQIDAMIPTLAAAPLGNRQFIYTGTPPGPNSPGEVFARIREDGLKGEASRLSWYEWSVTEIGDVSNVERWYETNPAMGIRISEEFTYEELASLGEDGFARERLGWWSSHAREPIVSEFDWLMLETDMPPDGKIAYGVKFSPDGSVVSVSVAVKPESGPCHVELLFRESASLGVTWIAEWLLERRAVASVVVIDGVGNAVNLYEKLCGAESDLQRRYTKKAAIVATSTNVAAASSEMANSIIEKSVTHFGQPALNNSVIKAEKRPIGSGGNWGWGGPDPTPIESASLALWGVKTTKRNPKRKMEVR